MTSNRKGPIICSNYQMSKIIYENAYEKLSRLTKAVKKLEPLKQKYEYLYLCTQALQKKAEQVCEFLFENEVTDTDRYIQGSIDDNKLSEFIRCISDLLSAEINEPEIKMGYQVKLKAIKEELDRGLVSDMSYIVDTKLKRIEKLKCKLKDIKNLITDFPDDEEACKAYIKLKSKIQRKTELYDQLIAEYALREEINSLWKSSKKSETMRSNDIPKIIKTHVQKVKELEYNQRKLILTQENDEVVLLLVTSKYEEFKPNGRVSSSSATMFVKMTESKPQKKLSIEEKSTKLLETLFSQPITKHYRNASVQVEGKFSLNLFKQRPRDKMRSKSVGTAKKQPLLTLQKI